MQANRPATGAELVIETTLMALALLSVVGLGLRVMGVLDAEYLRLWVISDYFVCVVFIIKVIWDVYQAEDKRAWLTWGWVDILASMPYVEETRSLRLLRFFLIFRALRATMRLTHALTIRLNYPASLAASVFSVTVLSLIFSSFILLSVEYGVADSNIHSAEHAVWWCLSTLLGADPAAFGEHYPVTTIGRLITLWLQVLSLGIIGAIAGLMVSWLDPDDHDGTADSNSQ